MITETYTEWLARIIHEDDPANGGRGILTLGDCRKCDGFGIVERVGTWANPTPRLESCAVCNGTGGRKETAQARRTFSHD